MASTSSCRLALQLRMSSVTGNPKDHWTLETGYFEDLTPAIQVQTLPLEGPRSLGKTVFCFTPSNLRVFSTRQISKILVDDLMKNQDFGKSWLRVIFRTLPFIKTWRAPKPVNWNNKNLAGSKGVLVSRKIILDAKPIRFLFQIWPFRLAVWQKKMVQEDILLMTKILKPWSMLGFKLPFPQLVSLPDFWTINSITNDMISSSTEFGHHPPTTIFRRFQVSRVSRTRATSRAALVGTFRHWPPGFPHPTGKTTTEKGRKTPSHQMCLHMGVSLNGGTQQPWVSY